MNKDINRMYINKMKSALPYLIISLVIFPVPSFIVNQTEKEWENIHSFIIGEDMFEYQYLRGYKLVSTYLYSSQFNVTRHKRNSQECMHFNLTLNNSLHVFCVFTNHIENGLVKNNTMIYVYGKSKIDRKTYNIKDLSITKAEGIDTVYSSNYLIGFVEENCFYGHILIEKNTYYLEPIASFPNISNKINSDRTIGMHFTAILYEERDLKVSSKYNRFSLNPDIEEWTVPSASYGRIYSQRFMRQQKRKANGRICTVMLFADHTFLQTIAYGNIKTAIAFMLYALDKADVIFRNTDFDEDGYPDNIGFRVKHIVVLTTEQHPFADIRLPKNVAIDGRLYLKLLTPYHLLDDVCIGIGFTSRVFTEKAIGVSFTGREMDKMEPLPGGICERSVKGMHLNVLAVTMFAAPNVRVPLPMVTLALAHELGHSFGSLHDDGDEENSPECRNHLMAKTSHRGTERWHYTFSPCSRRRISQTLRSKGFCLEKTDEQFCGNGLIEQGEECDCGLPFDCFERDPCCVARGAREDSCHVNRSAGFACHPSQGFCCMPNCQLRNLDYLGLNCSAEKDSCPCSKKNCNCGLFGSCLGDTCHSIECTRIGLTECPCAESGTKCTACCHDPIDGTCTSSFILTRMFQGKNISLPLLHRYANIPPRYVDKETFVTDRYCFRDDCVNVSFRIWKDQEFCVIFGKLGHCSSGTCYLKSPKLRSIDTRSIANLPIPKKIIMFVPLFMHLVLHFYVLTD